LQFLLDHEFRHVLADLFRLESALRQQFSVAGQFLLFLCPHEGLEDLARYLQQRLFGEGFLEVVQHFEEGDCVAGRGGFFEEEVDLFFVVLGQWPAEEVLFVSAADEGGEVALRGGVVVGGVAQVGGGEGFVFVGPFGYFSLEGE
jgi:hypothetical protein